MALGRDLVEAHLDGFIDLEDAHVVLLADQQSLVYFYLLAQEWQGLPVLVLEHLQVLLLVFVLLHLDLHGVVVLNVLELEHHRQLAEVAVLHQGELVDKVVLESGGEHQKGGWPVPLLADHLSLLDDQPPQLHEGTRHPTLLVHPG